MKPAAIELGPLTLDWSRPYIMGVINATPDSFSDGGRFAGPAEAAAEALALARAGADIIDIGGESTRPGAAAVGGAEEIDRVVPVIERLAGSLGDLRAAISVDTTKAAVAAAALDAGATLVNDISGGRFDPEIVDLCASRGAAYVLGHARGDDLAAVHAGETAPPSFEEVAFELAAAVTRLPLALRQRTLVDPGLGFGKKGAENLELVRRAGELASGCRRPVLVGPSRKRFVAHIAGEAVEARDAGTVGAALAAVACGAHVVRVHDVARLSPALAVYNAIVGTGSWTS